MPFNYGPLETKPSVPHPFDLPGSPTTGLRRWCGRAKGWDGTKPIFRHLFHPSRVGNADGALLRICFSIALVFLPLVLPAAQSGNSAPVQGTVTDPTGAVIPGATVHLSNAVSGLDRTVTTNPAGEFEIPNVPFNNYRVVVSASGFATLHQGLEIHSVVAASLKLILQIAAASQTVTVEASSAGDLVENDPTFHTDVDRDLFTKCRWRASRPRSALSSPPPPPASPPTPTASSTASAITRPTPFRSTASPSPISKARSSPTRSPPTPFNPSRSSPARRRPNTATKPAS